MDKSTKSADAKVAAGDRSESFLTESPKKGKPFAKADIPGFMHPLVEGKPDMSVYVPEDEVETEGGPVMMTREEALEKANRSRAKAIYPTMKE